MESRKKVLLVNDFESGGGAEGVFRLTAALLQPLYEVYKYTAYKGFGDSGSNPFSYVYSKKHFRNIKRIILEKDIDIVHVHNFRWISPSVFHVNRWLKKHHKKRVKFILTAHDYLLACPNVAYGYYDKKKGFVRYATDKHPGSFLFRQMDQHGIKFSLLKKMQWYCAFRFLKLQKEIDQVVSPSVFLKDILKLNYPNLPMEVIRNPISSDFKVQAREKTGNGNKEIRLVYVGRIASEKGTDLLLEMLASIKNEISFHLDIYGTGPLSGEINSMATRFGLTEMVTYHGFKPFGGIQEAFAGYDAFIMSSIWYENAPLSIVEAAMNGLKIIVPGMGGMKELAELCGNAFLYELGNKGSLRIVLENAQKNIKDGVVVDIQETLKSIFSEKRYLEKIISSYENPAYR